MAGGVREGSEPVAAKRVGRELVVAGDSLAVFPPRGRPGRQAGTGELAAVGPYILACRVTEADAVTIPRVWHAAQDDR